MAINAGPIFKINPSISFMVNYDPNYAKNPEQELRAAWDKLIDGGKPLMPLQEYPFSKLYGWVEDKYGVSWQLILTEPEGEDRPEIIPSLLFTKDGYGKVDEAIKFYMSVFKNSKLGAIARYPAGMEPDEEGKVMFSDFQLAGVWMAAMESKREHNFEFNEGVSLIIRCEDQSEIDYYWEKLSAVPEAEQCGWLKDKFGVSWQVVPTAMDDIMNTSDRTKLDRITQTFLKMKKLDLAQLKEVAKEK